MSAGLLLPPRGLVAQPTAETNSHKVSGGMADANCGFEVQLSLAGRGGLFSSEGGVGGRWVGGSGGGCCCLPLALNRRAEVKFIFVNPRKKDRHVDEAVKCGVLPVSAVQGGQAPTCCCVELLLGAVRWSFKCLSVKNQWRPPPYLPSPLASSPLPH